MTPLGGPKLRQPELFPGMGTNLILNLILSSTLGQSIPILRSFFLRIESYSGLFDSCKTLGCLTHHRIPDMTSPTALSSAPSTASAPPSPVESPTTSMSRASTPGSATEENHNFLDDIFGTSPPNNSHGGGFDHFSQTSAAPSPRPQPESSDIPAIRRLHVTSGYRDGLSSSKNAHIQRGFDDGFPVGASVGLRVGIILGTLEGLARGQYDGSHRKNKSGLGDVTPAAPRDTETLDLLKRARQELRVEKAFEGVGEETEGQIWKGEEKVREWEERLRSISLRSHSGVY